MDKLNEFKQLYQAGHYQQAFQLAECYYYNFSREFSYYLQQPSFLQMLFRYAGHNLLTNMTREHLRQPIYRQAMVDFAIPSVVLERDIGSLLCYPELRPAIIRDIDPNQHFMAAVEYFDDYPFLLEALLANKNKLAAVDNQTISETLASALTRTNDINFTDQAGNNSYQEAITRLLTAGLNPNIEVAGKPLLLAALAVNNYQLVKLLLATPGFVLHPNYVTIIDEKLQPLLEIRREMSQRFGLAIEAGKKRARFDQSWWLDDD